MPSSGRGLSAPLPSGRAEDGGVFATDVADRGRGLWVISRFEPPTAIGSVVFYEGRSVERLDVALEPDGALGRRVTWTRTYTGLGEAGTLLLISVTGSSLDTRMRRQLALLEHLCATGTMWME